MSKILFLSGFFPIPYYLLSVHPFLKDRLSFLLGGSEYHSARSPGVSFF